MAILGAAALVSCSTADPADSATSTTPPTEAASTQAHSSAPSTQDALDVARADMATEGEAMLANDPQLNRLVTGWEEVTGEECTPQAADFDSQRSAVFCGNSNIVATFDSPAQQSAYREAFISLKGSGPGPDAVVDGEGWSIYTEFRPSITLAIQLDGRSSNLPGAAGGSADTAPQTVDDSPTPAQSSTTSAKETRCWSTRKADSTVELWNGALASPGTQKSETLFAAFRAGMDVAQERQEQMDIPDCPGLEWLKFKQKVTSLELAELAPDGITNEDLAAVAEAGNEWLAEIGRSDISFKAP